jgi:hypothetical protein
MKLAVVAVGLFALGCLQGSATAENWSDWITSNNHDVQYRWLGSTAGGSGECQLQLRDLKRSHTTVVSVEVDYQSEQAESTRETVTIAGPQKDEDQGPTVVHHCASIGDLHVTNIARR